MKSNRVKAINFIGLIMPFLVFAFVSGCGDEFETVTLSPDSKRFYLSNPGHGDCGLADGPVGIPCGACFFTMGRSCKRELPSDDSTIVGYSHSYSKWGISNVCTCWEYVNCSYRGYVGFNLSPVKGKGIVTANLKWDEENNNSVGSSAGNSLSCLHKVFSATEPWREDANTAGELYLQYDPSNNKSIDVSRIVREWHQGHKPNYGFFFVGHNESTGNKDNNKCLTTMTNLRLVSDSGK